MAGLRREFIKTDYGHMHVRLAGVGSVGKLPLLCLHMAPQSGQDFETLMKIAGEDRMVIAPDYPGYGDSDPINEAENVTIETYARSIWQALDALGKTRVEILGYHTGSKVGIEMALQFPDRVKQLYCISLSSMTPEQYASSDMSFSPLWDETPGDEVIEWWHKLKNYYDPDMPFETLVGKYAISIKAGKRLHLGFRAAHLYNAKVIEKLKSLRAPTVIINPNDDLKAVTPLAAQYIAECELIDRPDWLPGFLETKPEEVVETIESAFSKSSRKNKPAESLITS